MCESEIQLCQDINLKWHKDFTLLGITYDNKLSKMQDFVSSKVEEIKKVLNLWRYRNLTPFGKITVIKTLALPKITHIALILPELNETLAKQIEKILINFLWNGKNSKVAKNTIIMPEDKGGLNMINLPNF